MKDSYKLFVVVVIIMIGFSYYWLCPKYQFNSEANGIYRYNRITGSVQVYTSKHLRWINLDNFKSDDSSAK